MCPAGVPACIDHHEIQDDESEKIKKRYQVDYNLLRTGPAHDHGKHTIEERQQKHVIITVMNVIHSNVNRYEECQGSQYAVYYSIHKPPSFSHGHCNKQLLTLCSKHSAIITSVRRTISRMHPTVRNRILKYCSSQLHVCTARSLMSRCSEELICIPYLNNTFTV